MHVPARFAAVILSFAPVFLQQRTWCHAELLLIGAILAPGKRTVTSLLRIAGLGRERRDTAGEIGRGRPGGLSRGDRSPVRRGGPPCPSSRPRSTPCLRRRR